MKKAKKYSRTIGGGYLTASECEEIDTLIDAICNNHSDESWWKIECSIKRRVEYRLSCRLADDSFAEDFEKEDNDGR